MARCAYCGTSILFGGVQDGERRFCNENCHQQGFLLAVADQVPEDVMAEHVKRVHEGNCPKCGGQGPVDVQTSYTIWSAVFLTSFRSRPEVCCSSCGFKSKLGGLFISSVFGWWGIPWGIIMTPVQIVRNFGAMFSAPDPMAPSDQLQKLVRANLAAHLLQASREEEAAARQTNT